MLLLLGFFIEDKATTSPGGAWWWSLLAKGSTIVPSGMRDEAVASSPAPWWSCWRGMGLCKEAEVSAFLEGKWELLCSQPFPLQPLNNSRLYAGEKNHLGLLLEGRISLQS